jgi:type VI secretion system FHA domain protein
MYLMLEVVGSQAASLGALRRQVVGPKGLTIGRAPDNDWLIPDPYVSKQHARITFSDGRFFVEGLGRNPIAIGSANNAIPSSQPTPLRSGDRLFIDRYEILVTAHPGDPPGFARAPTEEDPFGAAVSESPSTPIGDLPATDSLPADTPIPRPASQTPASLIPDVWNGSTPDVSGETAELDPLLALEKGEVQSPLPVSAEITPSQGIPENWARSILIQRQAIVERESAAPQRTVASPSPMQRQPRGSPLAQTPAVSAGSEPTARSASIASPLPDSDTNSGVARSSAVQGPHRPAPESAVRRSAAASPAGLDLAELLRAAGVPERDMSPEVAHELGKVLRVVVQGVMEVLQARAEIKSQFRLPVTRVQARENNPLKLSPNVESALHTLLVQHNPGYLPTVQAFEDAFADIRNHQMAMLEGVRVAFNAMLSAFDPQELEKEFERTIKRTGLLGGLSGRSRYWDLYSERFSRFGRHADETFRRLFGEFLAEAYEKQLERLKSLQTGQDADG